VKEFIVKVTTITGISNIPSDWGEPTVFLNRFYAILVESHDDLLSSTKIYPNRFEDFKFSKEIHRGTDISDKLIKALHHLSGGKDDIRHDLIFP
jgi:hypothetical protein